MSISNNKVSKKIYYHNVSLYNWPDIDYISYVYKLNLSFIPVLFKTIKKYGPFDILCSFDWTVSIAAKAGASSYQLIWVNFLSSLESIRNDLENTDNNYIFTMEKFILKQKNTIITESNYLESELRKMCKKDKNIKIITGLKRISKPGLRVYANKESLPKVLGGLGTAIISTNKGVITDKEARKLNVGGEVLAFIW